ncbi:HNH endonuclease signature motif containing protein [Gordonia neofelifaecis]|uniref:HNH endonuclease n=1 Tax=Gordonia neofelifaecis NRRL B-59395 TaxID=644548 RepID=F1YJP9_9ACTN|nr:HNH endonuclease signature motif containing protein [Gordonia neofelifaecis]EGD54981.1 HNH endonuclease [Gordonia neofelifaecis NRRL B-59395]
MTTADDIAAFNDRLIDDLSPPGTDSPGGEFAQLVAAPSRLGFDDGALLQTMVELTRTLNLVSIALSKVTVAAEEAGIPRRKGVKTGSDLLKELGVPPAVAHRFARAGRTAPQLPELSRLARIGGMPIEHLDAVGRGIAFVEKRIPLDTEAKSDLARRLAAQANPADVNRRARELAIEWSPEIDATDPGSLPIAENPELNEMTVVTGDDGRTAVTLDIDALTAEELQQVLDPLCRPVLQPDGSADPRPAGRRRSDAIAQVLHEYLSGRDRPTSAGGVLPHVTLIVPTRATTPPRSEDTWCEESSPVAMLGFTGPVSPTTAGLVLCEASMRKVVLDAQSAPIDVGREMRLVSVALRKALEARDRGCAFPGCGRPVSWTDAHHCVPWSDGGETSVDNCVLLCRMHHSKVHLTGWEVFIGHDRHPWFRAPADPDRPQRPREVLRSHARRTMTIAPTAAA